MQSKSVNNTTHCGGLEGLTSTLQAVLHSGSQTIALYGQ